MGQPASGDIAWGLTIDVCVDHPYGVASRPVRTHTWWRALVRVTIGLRRCKAAVCRGITLAWCVRGMARGAGERRR